MIERRSTRFTGLFIGALCGTLMGCSERGPAADTWSDKRVETA